MKYRKMSIEQLFKAYQFEVDTLGKLLLLGDVIITVVVEARIPLL